jgi:kinetochore protein Spc24
LTNDLRRLQRQHTALQQQHELEAQKYSPQEHAQKILEMDGKKFRVAKEASEAEIEGERLEVEVDRSERSLGESKKRAADGVEGGGFARESIDKSAEQTV